MTSAAPGRFVTRGVGPPQFVSADLLTHLDRLVRSRRLLELRIGGEKALDRPLKIAARYRDALDSFAAWFGGCRCSSPWHTGA